MDVRCGENQMNDRHSIPVLLACHYSRSRGRGEYPLMAKLGAKYREQTLRVRRLGLLCT